ncbi:unnamed protein product, partial [Staurois parvus]
QQCNHLCPCAHQRHPAVAHTCAQQCPPVPPRTQQCCQSVPPVSAQQLRQSMPNSATSQYLAVSPVSAQQ